MIWLLLILVTGSCLGGKSLVLKIANRAHNAYEKFTRNVKAVQWHSQSQMFFIIFFLHPFWMCVQGLVLCVRENTITTSRSASNLLLAKMLGVNFHGTQQHQVRLIFGQIICIKFWTGC